MSLAYLKVKIKSLAAEAKIIRHEERIWKERGSAFGRAFNEALAGIGNAEEYARLPKAKDIFFGLRSHRTWDVRNEARAAQLAYAFLRGKSYAATEPTGKDNGGRQSHPIDWKRVTQLVVKYGLDRTLIWEQVREWAVPKV